MKEAFTVREVMDGTGLTRQRVHQLIKSRGIPVIWKNKRILVKWLDLLNIADNPAILAFLRRTLLNERKLLEAAYKNLEESEKAIRFAKAIRYAMILAEGAPEVGDKDRERVKEWITATCFFDGLSAFENPAMKEQNEEREEPLVDD
jgi:putative cell wall-binding protein